MKPSTGAAVRLHRNAVRDRPDSLSAFKRNACPLSAESASGGSLTWEKIAPAHQKLPLDVPHFQPAPSREPSMDEDEDEDEVCFLELESEEQPDMNGWYWTDQPGIRDEPAGVIDVEGIHGPFKTRQEALDHYNLRRLQ
jgi:hypothetical protein